jgi:hypothetical protein
VAAASRAAAADEEAICCTGTWPDAAIEPKWLRNADGVIFVSSTFRGRK